MPRPFYLAVLIGLAGCSASREAVSPAPSPPPVVETAEAATPPADEPEPAASTPAASVLPGEAPREWLRLDEDADGVRGISLTRALEALGDRRPQRRVVVAVIDSGVEITHDDLEGRIWTNAGEVAGNGLDDDGNGYADDLHGWSFLGNANGENVQHERLEITRLVAQFRDRFAGVDPDALSDADKAEYDRFRAMEEEMTQKREQARQDQKEYGEMLAQTEQVETTVAQATTVLQNALGKEYFTNEDLAPGFLDTEQVQWAKNVMRYLQENGITSEQIAYERELLGKLVHAARTEVEYKYNPDYDPRPLVGDDPDDPDERYYGSPDVQGPYASHGTSVSSVIAAVRGNDFGVDGITRDSVFIMALRAVPSGDERDKDIANAIRYAVDNGAHVINMSFGKAYSPNKRVVDDAIRHAAEHGVLLVHGAGNDGADLDADPNFPTPILDDGTRADNWLEVGATTAAPEVFAATFSNYGQTSVDLFAPGADIDMLDLENGTTRADGTSFAAPVVAGVAALLLSYYPELTPLDAREIILESAVPYRGTTAQRPGLGGPVDFGTLSVTGGVVNAARAVERAEARTGS